VVTSQSRDGRPVMACWQRNRQVTQPPAVARRRRTDMSVAKTTAAVTAVPPTAITAAARPAVAT
jgi:hypothetical protein